MRKTQEVLWVAAAALAVEVVTRQGGGAAAEALAVAAEKEDMVRLTFVHVDVSQHYPRLSRVHIEKGTDNHIHILHLSININRDCAEHLY